MTFTVHSDRLTFTKLASSDWELIHSIYSNPTLMEHIGEPMSTDAIRRNFEKELASWSLDSTHWLTWIIRETASDHDVGLFSICTRNREERTAEVGFILLEAYKGKGYATEALQSVISFSSDTLGFQKITAVCSEDHIASRRVLEKAGMRLEQIVPERTEIAGKLVNDCLYSLERS